MAPRRGGGGSSSSGSGASICPGAFVDSVQQAHLALYVIMFFVYIMLLIMACTFRKKVGQGKRLIGVPFILALVSSSLSTALVIIGWTLQQCGQILTVSYYDFQVAITVFDSLGEWLLLFVVVWTLNTMLRKQLGPHGAVLKVLTLAIIAIMGALTAGLIGLQGYIYYCTYRSMYRNPARRLGLPLLRLRIAYYCLYLVGVLASGALSLTTITKLRSRQLKAGDLLGWVIALTITMAAWPLITMAVAANQLQTYYPIERVTNTVLSYFINLFFALSFVMLLCIAKHVGWSQPIAGNIVSGQAYAPVAQHQQYAYNATTNGQVYHPQGPVQNHGADNGQVYSVPSNGHVYQQQTGFHHDAPELATDRK